MRITSVISAALLLQGASSFQMAREFEKSMTAPNSSCVNLMIIGDYGSKRSAQRRVASSMAQVAASVNADAVLALGDNIYEHGASSSSQMVRDWRDVYLRYDGNRRPWYAVMGNHDWRTPRHVQRDFTSSSKNIDGHWNMPSYWYKKQFGNAEVFFVDTQVWRRSVRSMRSQIHKQEQWLDSALSNSTAAWKIVVGHHPTWSAGSHGGSSTMQKELDPIMRRHGASIFFAGHDHSQQHIEHESVNYIVSGAGVKRGRARSNDYPFGSLRRYQGEEGFASLEICDDSQATLKLHTSNGGVGYQSILRNIRRPSPITTPPCPFSPPSPATVENKVKGPALCMGVKLAPVDMRCSRDGCTVQPDTSSSEISCEMYCSEHGLSCAGAWSNGFEDCGLDQEISCTDLVTGSGSQVCRCGAKWAFRAEFQNNTF